MASGMMSGLVSLIVSQAASSSLQVAGGAVDARGLEEVLVVEEEPVAGEVRDGVLDAVVLGVVAERRDDVRRGPPA